MCPDFIQIPQSLFPDQRDDEKIYITVRRYLITFMVQTIFIGLLFLVPLVFFIVSYQQLITFLSATTPFVVDLIIFLLVIYYLSLAGVLMINWMRHYYTRLIVTNERIYITNFQGLFSLLPHEFTLEEISEVTFRPKGSLGYVYNIGDISLHIPRQQQNYLVEAVNSSQIVAKVISDLVEQTKQKIPPEKREPTQGALGVIDRKVIKQSQKVPPIMNFGMGIKNAQQAIINKGSKPTGIKEKFDLWWWTQLKKEHILYIDYSPAGIDIIAHEGASGEKKNC